MRLKVQIRRKTKYTERKQCTESIRVNYGAHGSRSSCCMLCVLVFETCSLYPGGELLLLVGKGGVVYRMPEPRRGGIINKQRACVRWGKMVALILLLIRVDV